MQRNATAVWKGTLKEGSGTLDVQSGALSAQPYSFKTRFQDEGGKSGTNPEELIAAAHAGCFAMQLSAFLENNGTPAEKLEARGVVTLIPGTGITESAITLVGTVPGIEEAKFKELADKAKAECPVSKALGAIKVYAGGAAGLSRLGLEHAVAAIRRDRLQKQSQSLKRWTRKVGSRRLPTSQPKNPFPTL